MAFRFNPDCNVCGGDCQCNGAAPDEYQVVITGIGNGTCSACTLGNGTFVLTRLAPQCIWEYTEDTICGFIVLRLFINSGTTWVVDWDIGGKSNCSWLLTRASSEPCAVTDLTIPFQAFGNHFLYPNHCTISAPTPTAVVTSL